MGGTEVFYMGNKIFYNTLFKKWDDEYKTLTDQSLHDPVKDYYDLVNNNFQTVELECYKNFDETIRNNSNLTDAVLRLDQNIIVYDKNITEKIVICVQFERQEIQGCNKIILSPTVAIYIDNRIFRDNAEPFLKHKIGIEFIETEDGKIKIKFLGIYHEIVKYILQEINY